MIATDTPIDALLRNGHDPTTVLEITKADDRLADLLDRPFPLGLNDQLRFDHERDRWHWWDKHLWKPDTTGYVYEMLRDRLFSWFVAYQNQSGVIKELTSLLNLPKKKSVLETFSYRRSVALTGSEWDQDPNIMGAPNGLIDLRSGKLLTSARPELLISRSVRVPYSPKSDPAKDCPMFLEFLHEITAGDMDKANYLLRIFGYAMFGLQTEQKFWLFTGAGNNGKGTLTKTIAHIFGDYAASPAATLYMRSRQGSPPSNAARNDLIALHGIRLAPMSEPEGGAFNDELLKAHTGDDPIRARANYKAEIEFRPTHTIIVSTNQPPAVEDVGKSMQRRVRVVPFTESFDGPRMDRDLEAKLKTESVGILSLLVHMASRWYEEGLEEPESITAASAAYIDENDPLSEFVYAMCVLDPSATTGGRPLYDAYCEWAAHSGRPMGKNEFGASLARRIRRTRLSSGQVYIGIRLKSAVELLPPEQ
jgi:putative DNA primase/helicase